MTRGPVRDLRRALGVARRYAAGSRFATRARGKPEAGADVASRANPLEAIFDAHTDGPGIFKWRHYFEVYHRHLAKFVGREVNVCEVGIYSGGSLSMWREYLGPRSHIYGVDVEEGCRVYAGEGVDVHIGDQGDREFWRRFVAVVPPLDVVIDDGSHRTDDQILTLESLLGHLRPGGVYIVEDVHGRHHGLPVFLAGLAGHLNDVNAQTTPLQQAVGSVHLYPSLAVLERPEDPGWRLASDRRGTLWQPFTAGEKGT